jgi:hypothetical protein
MSCKKCSIEIDPNLYRFTVTSGGATWKLELHNSRADHLVCKECGRKIVPPTIEGGLKHNRAYHPDAIGGINHLTNQAYFDAVEGKREWRNGQLEKT